MLTLTAAAQIVNSDPIEVETIAPYTEEDAAYWMAENTGGCHPDDRSPEERMIDSAMTAWEFHLDQCGDEFEAMSLYDSGYSYL